MRKIRGMRNKQRLTEYDKTIFIGSRDEIRYYVNMKTLRAYAEACFYYVEQKKDFLRKEWFQLNRADIEGPSAYDRTEKEIAQYFGHSDI